MNVLLDLQIIREDITPTNPPTVEKIDAFRFTDGEQRTLAIQLINAYNKKPWVLPAGWEVSIELLTTDPDVPLTGSMVINTTDRSIMTFDLTSVNTPNLISGRIKLTVFETGTPTNKMIINKSGLFVKTKEKCDC